jgi:hypothetical protein
MFIRHLIGPRKGEIEEIIFDRARAKVLSGEAEDVYNQLGIAPKPVSVAAEPEVHAYAGIDLSMTSEDRAFVGNREITSNKKKQRR